MRTLIILLLPLLALAGCHTEKSVTTERTTADSVSRYSSRLDSLLRATTLRDSTYERDSILVMVKGDTVRIYRDRVRYRDRVHTDTLWRILTVHDTITTTHDQSAESTLVERVEKPLPWYDRLCLWLGRLGVLALLLLAAVRWLSTHRPKN